MKPITILASIIAFSVVGLIVYVCAAIYRAAYCLSRMRGEIDLREYIQINHPELWEKIKNLFISDGMEIICQYFGIEFKPNEYIDETLNRLSSATGQKILSL